MPFADLEHPLPGALDVLAYRPHVPQASEDELDAFSDRCLRAVPPGSRQLVVWLAERIECLLHQLNVDRGCLRPEEGSGRRHAVGSADVRVQGCRRSLVDVDRGSDDPR